MTFIWTRRFYPLFATQFFGAANDNFLKNAMLILVTYQLGRTEEEVGGISNLAAALFILPYFLFSTLAGQLADKFDKAPYCRAVKLAEIVLMIAAAVGFYFRSLPVLIVVLGFMGAQSTFFSPAKYSLLPLQLKPEELLCGNAWISAGTYLAILFGVMSGGILITLKHGPLICGGALILFAVIGYWGSSRIPSAPSLNPALRIDWNLFRQTWSILKTDVWRQVKVRHCIYSLAFFWLAGSLYLTQLPQFTKSRVGGNEMVCTGFFVLFSIGIGVGAWLINRILHGKTRVNPALIGAIAAMGLLTFDLALIAWTSPFCPEPVACRDLFRTFRFYRTAADLFLIAVCGGMWSVPLQSLMQKASKRDVLARVIAGNNIVNSLYMAGGALLVALLMKFSVNLGWIFAGLALILLGAAVYTTRLLPDLKRTPRTPVSTPSETAVRS